MASSFDLQRHIDALQAAGFTVAGDYMGKPAKWLTTALDDVDLRVINCKGVKLDDIIVMVRLSKLEELVAAVDPMQAGTPHAMHSAQ